MEEELRKKFLSPENWLTLLSKTKFVTHKKTLLLVLIGFILIGVGIIYFKSGDVGSGTRVEVLSETSSVSDKEITVEAAGEVVNPGVYKLPGGSRVNDLLVAAGGFSATADREGVEKYLNRAAKLTDGQKIYIPKQSDVLSAKSAGGDQTISTTFSGQTEGLTNINSASLSKLDKLPGIGPVYGQSIIDHRPYSNIEELVSKGAIKQSVYNKIKDLVTVF